MKKTLEVLFVCSFVVFLSIKSYACKRPVGWKPQSPLSVPQAFDTADLVFEGKFMSGKSIGAFDYETKFSVLRVWKGKLGTEVTVATKHSTCDPYPYWSDHSLDNTGNFSAKLKEPAVLVFHKQNSGFLNVKTDTSSKDELESLSKHTDH